MSVIWYKVLADLWSNKIRTILAIISIATGVFAVGSTFGMVDQMLTGMDAAHQAVKPSHINMFLTDEIDETTAIRLKKIKGIVDIDVMNRETIRYKINPEDEWDTGVLVMRADYDDQTYDVVQLKEGHWPKREKFGIERLSSQHFEVDIGDSVIIEVDDKPYDYQINGKIRHPFVPPPQFGGPAHFFTDEEGLERFDIDRGEFRQLKVQVEPYSEQFVREVATEIKNRLAKEDVGVAVVFYQDPQKHWGRSIMEGINFVLQTLAIVSLAASVVLILNTLMALVAEQTNQIGIIKAIGGTTMTVAKIYLVGVFIYGVLALVISLPLGTFIAFGASQNFLNLFNIDYETFQFSNRAVTYQIIAALVVPLIAALWPILNGAAMTVREAIASYGLGSGRFGHSRLDRLIEMMGQRLFSTPYATALGNMFRRKGRLGLTQLVLIIAGTMFLAVMTLSSSLTLTLDNEFFRRNYDSKIILEGNQRADQAIAIAESMEGIDEAESWFNVNADMLKAGQRLKEAGISVQLTGIPAGSDIFKPMLVGGRWLEANDGRAVVVLKDTAEKHGINLGDKVLLNLGELGHHEWQVVGFYQSVLSGGIGSIDPIYANLEAVYKATKKHNDVAEIYIRTKIQQEYYADGVTTQLKQLFERKNIETVFSETVYKFRTDLESQFSITINMLLMLAIIVAIIGGIGLMGSLSISVVERTREIGVMRAVGAQSYTIMGMFIMEGVLQGVTSWAVAVPISFVLGKVMANAMGQVLFNNNLDYEYNLMAVFVWFAVILVISVLASIIPARRATHISVRESLAYA